MTQEWTQQLVDRVGREVRRARTASSPPLSGQALSDRTAELGHPISRAVISDLETGRRRGLDVADLIVLAAALRISPVQLLFPELPRGSVDVLPGRPHESHDAVRWFAGETGLFASSGDWETGTGESAKVWTREELAPEIDRITVTRQWLRAIASMRGAQSQITRALASEEPREQISTLEDLYDDARDRAEKLVRQMTELGMDVREGDPRV
ncbi:XRE family transcriptional regulator [Rhodococcus corynebacterioides]|uniref:XRE family transcriptional regulator n=1 Tax=Rhodococcoides corynebacterioides TaxID=53972 RepID=A0ABS7P3H3_9NOCA|nr:XRE family transcriptional regulator [Rhodococcus corynebacterioides]MBY6407765.1 XRE family transcriptional regulator [Rhodococcus corynebacterioides]